MLLSTLPRPSSIITFIYRTHGIGPKITSGWDAYFDNEGRDAGVDSLGDVVKSDKSAGLTEQHVYSGMMTKW